jgi:opacity protein-like surface antigen
MGLTRNRRIGAGDQHRARMRVAAICGRSLRKGISVAHRLDRLSLAAAAILVGVAAAHGADIAQERPAPAFWNWSGLYVGGHVGAALDTANVSDPFGSSIYGDQVRSPAFLGGGQIGLNWQLPNSPWVLGAEADISALDSDGTNTCLAFSGYFVSATCRSRPDLTATFTARLGYAFGPSGRTLFYAKGGAAWMHNNIEVTNNAFPGAFPGVTGLDANSTVSQLGWTVGGGVEHALTPAWSLRLEYDYLGFGNAIVATPTGFLQAPPGGSCCLVIAPGTTSVNQNVHQAKLGLNYTFGADPVASWDRRIDGPVLDSGWEMDVGGRYWYSSGRFQKDLGNDVIAANATSLASRLTYVSNANSGELYGRLETPSNLFVKGFVGGGSYASGTLNDEDWLLFFGPPTTVVPYSNTLSSPVTGAIAYATVDAGYDFMRGPGYKLGSFIGYNYYADNKSAFGCAQIANSLSDCVPAIPNSILGITENDKWQSLRVGVAGELMVFDRLKLSGDLAYLPYVRFDGTDNHVLIPSISPESGTGRGVQLEAILSYFVSQQLSLGAGARYWAMWTSNDAITNYNGAPCPCQTLPAKTERYGGFLHASYRFGEPAVAR